MWFTLFNQPMFIALQSLGYNYGGSLHVITTFS